MRTWKVFLKSVPGVYRPYSGEVEVLAIDDGDAVERALIQMQRGVFKNQSCSMWYVERVEEVRK